MFPFIVSDVSFLSAMVDSAHACIRVCGIAREDVLDDEDKIRVWRI